MTPDVLIVGQGIAGTLVAWELDRAGVSFVVASDGGAAASAAAAGIVNPITGRRLVKSWRVETLLPLARETYAEIERSLGATLWHDMRVRRLFADEGERATFAAKQRRGELAPFAGAGDDEGFWIESAARVDLPLLLSASRKRFSETGRYRTEVVASLAHECERYAWVIDCRGVAGARATEFAFVPWEFSCRGSFPKARCSSWRSTGWRPTSF
jgi:glycine oxidase